MGEVVAIVLLIGLYAAIVVLLPAAGLWWLSQWLRRRNYARAARISQVLLLAFSIFCSIGIYSFYFPFDSEFKDEFRQLTGLPFPKSGEVVEGEMFGLDLQGDYFINAQAAVDSSDYQCILNNIRTDSAFHAVLPFSDTASASYSRSAVIRKPGRPLTQTFTKENAGEGRYESISLLPDQRTITFHRSQN